MCRASIRAIMNQAEFWRLGESSTRSSTNLMYSLEGKSTVILIPRTSLKSDFQKKKNHRKNNLTENKNKKGKAVPNFFFGIIGGRGQTSWKVLWFDQFWMSSCLIGSTFYLPSWDLSFIKKISLWKWIGTGQEKGNVGCVGWKFALSHFFRRDSPLTEKRMNQSGRHCKAM